MKAATTTITNLMEVRISGILTLGYWNSYSKSTGKKKLTPTPIMTWFWISENSVLWTSSFSVSV
jgi:hypothetical protein